MVHYSKEFLLEIKRKVNLKELVEEYTKVVPAGNNLWMARCPHPDHDDSTPSFRLCLNDNGIWSWYCGGCHMGTKNLKATEKNYGTDCFAFVSWMSDYHGSKHVIKWREAVKILAQRAGVQITPDENDKKLRLLRGVAKARHKALLDDRDALSYLKERGITDESIKRFMIGVSEKREFGCAAKRITFPLIDRYHRVLGETARLIHWNKSSKQPKYRNSPNSAVFHKSEFFFGIHNYDETNKTVYITEGAMDVVLAAQSRLKNVIATLGTSLTKEHATILKDLGVAPCLCMDGDEAGQKAVRRTIELLGKEDIFASVLMLPEGKDLADLAIELGENLEKYVRLHTMTYWQYLLMEPLRIYDAQVSLLRSEIMTDVVKASKGVCGINDRILMQSFVKERFGIEL